MPLGNDHRDFDEPVWDEEAQVPDIWQRLSRLTLACIVIVVVLASLLLFWPQFEAQRGEASRARALEESKASSEELLAKRRLELHWLRTDLAYLERIARDRLGRAKPDEYIIRVDRSAE